MIASASTYDTPDHCDSPCDTAWVNLPRGQHDLASTDASGRDHCAHCVEPVTDTEQEAIT